MMILKYDEQHCKDKNIQKIKISKTNSSKHHLRAEHTEEGMSTIQAIASALQIIEGETAAAPLFKLYEEKLKNTLLGRGHDVKHLY